MPKIDKNNNADILPPLTVETLVNGGNGLVRYNGQVIFVPKVAVGDTIRCQIVRSKKTYAEGQVAELVMASDDRRLPPCPAAGECGGCQWQHLPYEVQAQWKERLFRDTLVRKCRIDEALIQQIAASEGEFGYRSRVQFKCYNTANGFETGFYRPRSRYVVGVDSCPILRPELNELMSQLRSCLTGARFASKIPQIDMAVDADGKRVATVHYLGGDERALVEHLRRFSGEADLLIQLGAKAARTIVSGDGILTIEVDEPPMRLSYQAGSFAQINLEQNRRMVSEVMSLLSWTGKETVVDLYCGMGNFSLPLARRAGRVVGIEESASSIEMAKINAQKNDIENISFVCANAEDSMVNILAQSPPEVLVLDPPRSGAFGVIKKIANSAINHIIYVSCDPQTLARDLECLVHNGYDLISSIPVDMFPQTYHCESISYLKRKQ